MYSPRAYVIDEVIDRVRAEVESCSSLDGFQLCFSLGGGCSGFASLITSKLKEEYPDSMMTSHVVLPTVKPNINTYNAVLSLHQLIENDDLTLCYDNDNAIKLWRRLNRRVSGNPIDHDLNDLISNTMSDVTASFRFHDGSVNTNLRLLCQNMKPFYRTSFLITSASLPMSTRPLKSTNQLIAEVFADENWLSGEVPPDSREKHLASCVQMRGDSVVAKEAEECHRFHRWRRTQEFVDWIPDNAKLNVIRRARMEGSQSLEEMNRTATLIANSTSITHSLGRLQLQFNEMFRRKAFLHHLTNVGMDELDFKYAESCLNDFINGYSTLFTDQVDC
eukprot:TRINITY_DN11941_c0_g3_i1.p1 TRINITY_DN11941_c0_g3~~TRINITY_DN11941_c0_g3_i1.p1  ORF type:complete len:334 (+),score=63.13 TRINITY_DN11941_c0_g3_i1:345-1346(+)